MKGHFQEVCPSCAVVVRQCRCMGPHEVRVAKLPCARCRAAEPMPPPVLPIPSLTVIFPTPREPVDVFVCGGDRCPKGGVHDWSGPENLGEDFSEATCAKCGLGAIAHSLMNAP